MKIGNLVKSAEAWGPDEYGDEYYPVGVVYRRHKHRERRWWVRWISPECASSPVDCMLDEWLEILNEAR